MKRYFITGTDTDCGKTYVTCQLLNWFRQQGQKAQALKPVASGCIEQNGIIVSEDAMNLQACNYDQQLTINNWQFTEAVSPHIAAKNSSIRISVRDIASYCSCKMFADFDPLLIEGAGGLLVPLNEQETWLDFLQLTAVPVILVVGMRLGCINHALLTDSVLKTHKIACVGWIANCLHKDMLALDDNIATLSSTMSMPLLGYVPYGGSLANPHLSHLP